MIQKEVSRQASSPEHGLRFYVLNLDKRREDKLVSFERVVESDAPWILDSICRVSAPDATRWGAQITEDLAEAQVWKDAKNVTASREMVKGDTLEVGAMGCLAGHALVWEHIA